MASLNVDVVEGRIAVPGGEVWYRKMGSGGVPLVIVHGGPGFPCDILFDAFEPLAAEREVVWYDQLGVGNSDPIEDPALLTVERFLDELGAVIAGLGLSRPHVYGHSWGAMLGLQYAAERAPDWTSLVCASGMASIPRFCAEVRELMAALPGDVLERTYGRELAGTTDDPDYMVALDEFMRAHTLRNPNPPVAMDWSRASLITFKTMIGHGDHHVSGTLSEWDIFDRLERIELPTLVLGGEHDESVPAHLADIASRIPDAEHVTQLGASHIAYLEEEPIRREYAAIVRRFLSRVEGEARGGRG